MVSSVCPYCAVSCAQRVYVSGERVIQIEGNQDSPISRGRLCPKGSRAARWRSRCCRRSTPLIGRFLPPGATVSIVRTAVYFRRDQHLEPFIVQAVWLVGTLAGLLISARRLGRGLAQ